MKVLRGSIGNLFEDYKLGITAEEIINILMSDQVYVVTKIDEMLRIQDYDGYME